MMIGVRVDTAYMAQRRHLFDSETPTAIFDLDGCLCSSATMSETSSWSDIWGDTKHPSNPEIIELLASLCGCGWNCPVLTGRPERYRKETLAWLRAQGLTPFMLGDGPLMLCMYPNDAQQNGSNHGEWKASVIRHWLRHGMRIMFAIEDHKPNAEYIRKLVPVLLYECVK